MGRSRENLRLPKRAEQQMVDNNLAFVDLGAHTGQTIVKAMQEYPHCRHYYAVEPLAHLIVAARKRIGYSNKDLVSFCQCALGVFPGVTTEGTVAFYEDTANLGQGSSLLPDKRINNRRETVVPCLDIDYYFQTYVDPTYKLILKIDIEGEEYEILEHLLENGFLVDRVIKLYVEWHWHKTKTISEKRHWDLVAKLNGAGFPLTGYSDKDEFWTGEN